MGSTLGVERSIDGVFVREIQARTHHLAVPAERRWRLGAFSVPSKGLGEELGDELAERLFPARLELFEIAEHRIVEVQGGPRHDA